jgi:hypothetical protein
MEFNERDDIERGETLLAEFLEKLERLSDEERRLVMDKMLTMIEGHPSSGDNSYNR